MKSTSRISLALGLLTLQLHAQPQTPAYIAIDLGKPGMGGPTSFAFSINSLGRVGGQAARADGSFHAFLSGIGHTLIDLGTLGGPNSGTSGLNFVDTVALVSDTKTKDANGGDYCAFGTHLICLGAVWQNGHLTALAPLPGGNNSYAQSINTQGQVAGWAETGTQDTTCQAPQVLRSQAAIWGPGGDVHALAPLPGDTVSFALAINDVGQAVGGSGNCANTPLAPFPTGPHAVLWDTNGTPRDLGSLSPNGSPLNVGAAINNLGMVVGGSVGPTGIHTYLWTSSTGMQDLGVLGSDLGNLPGGGYGGINNNGQVVGMSCSNAFCDMTDPKFVARAYLWQNGKMMDLNSLVVGGAPLYLIFACQINDAGVIVGYGATATGDIHAFELDPLPRH